MKVRFYNYSKRKNSTSQPSGTYTEKDCKLKDDTSMHDPTMQIASDPTPSFTYAYIPDWEKYYFVRDQISIAKGITDIVMVEDSMASHKTEIGATKARIVYSTSYIDNMIPDTRLAVKNSKQINTSVGGKILDATGCYVLTVLNEVSNSFGFGTTYIMDLAAVNTISVWFAQQYNNLATQFFNGSAMDGVFSLIWVPFPYPANIGSDVGFHPTDIYIGDLSRTAPTNVIQLKVPYRYAGMTSLDCNLRYTDFRQVEPYTTGTLFLPGVGNVELSMSDFVGKSKIYVKNVRNYMTGDLYYAVSSEPNTPSTWPCTVASYTCNVAATCPLGQILTNANGAVGSLASLGTSAIAGAGALALGSAAGTVGAVGAMIGSAAAFALQANRRQVSVSGNVGGMGWELLPGYVSGNDTGHIEHSEYSVDTEDPTDGDYQAFRGGPVCKTDTISNYLGYIQCEGASVLCSGSDQEREEINEMLNSGFYYA